MTMQAPMTGEEAQVRLVCSKPIEARARAGAGRGDFGKRSRLSPTMIRTIDSEYGGTS